MVVAVEGQIIVCRFDKHLLVAFYGGGTGGTGPTEGQVPTHFTMQIAKTRRNFSIPSLRIDGIQMKR